MCRVDFKQTVSRAKKSEMNTVKGWAVCTVQGLCEHDTWPDLVSRAGKGARMEKENGEGMRIEIKRRRKRRRMEFIAHPLYIVSALR